jgi:hypothetical protein
VVGEGRGSSLRALVLTGSLARREASIDATEHQVRVVGDAEFVIVLDEAAKLPDGSETRRLANELSRALAARGIQCHVTLAEVHPTYLRRLGPDIFAYELQSCGEVVRGDDGVLSEIPRFSTADLSKEDAWRLLSNRMIEHLGDLAKTAAADHEPGAGVRYGIVKLSLDTATSLLVFLGAYEPTYRLRAERLASLAPDGPADLPVSLPELAARVATFTRWKLDVPAAHLPLSWEDWRKTVEQASALWGWEMARLCGGDPDGPAEALWQGCARRQGALQRLRGWAHVARAQGWQSGRGDWLRWIRLGAVASPRYWVYRVAGELFSALPALLPAPEPGLELDPAWGKLRRHLPLLTPAEEGPTSWRLLARGVAANYERFLVATRS